MPASSRRHPLLIYARLFALWRLPALLIGALCGLLWWLGPGPLALGPVRAALLVAAVAGLAFFVYTLLGPRLAYVQCRPTHLRINTPFFRLAISYSRVRATRPVPFDPSSVRWSERRLVAPFRGQTVVALDLYHYPVSRRWLRLWLNEFMLADNFLGLLLLVPDWMALSRDIAASRSQWQTRHRDQDRQDTLTSLTVRRR
jgi:hypothetical protein